MGKTSSKRGPEGSSLLRCRFTLPESVDGKHAPATQQTRMYSVITASPQSPGQVQALHRAKRHMQGWQGLYQIVQGILRAHADLKNFMVLLQAYNSTVHCLQSSAPRD